MSFAPVATKRRRPELRQAQQPKLDPQWAQRHPVSAGLVKVEAYTPPRGAYQRPKGSE